MGCIEMEIMLKLLRRWTWINRNMGCIEILINWDHAVPKIRLIETWDVLKFVRLLAPIYSLLRINRNMGCIEIDNVWPTYSLR